MNKKTAALALISVLLINLFWGCSDDDNPADPVGENNFAAIINDYTDNVVIATYEDLKNKAAELKTACENFNNDNTQANLNAAANAWVSTREPWESSEAFLFGPVSFLSLDPSLDTWPLDESQLQTVLNSDFSLTPDFIRNGLGYSLRGFHTVEYFLFTNGQVRDASTLTARDREYLVSSVTVLAEDADMIYQEWVNGFGSEFKNAGNSGSRYNSETQAILQIVDGMGVIADEVGNGKISEPYVTKDVLTVESQFSWNSLTDFVNNIRGIKNVYTGGYHNRVNGTGLEVYMNSVNSELNIKVKNEIDAAIAAIDNIPEPFRNNLDASVQIQAAIDACNVLFETLEAEVKPAVSQ